MRQVMILDVVDFAGLPAWIVSYDFKAARNWIGRVYAFTSAASGTNKVMNKANTAKKANLLRSICIQLSSSLHRINPSEHPCYQPTLTMRPFGSPTSR